MSWAVGEDMMGAGSLALVVADLVAPIAGEVLKGCRALGAGFGVHADSSSIVLGLAD
jgi:hypothetical protein